MAAEVHIIGQLESAYGFEPGDNRLCCRWALHFGGGWRVIEGDQEGQTQTDLPDTDRAYFAHPIDIHLATRTIQGWPKMLLEVWNYDRYGRHQVCGYGICLVPTSPGEHQVECHCWRPRGNLRDELSHRFVGGGFQLRSLAVLTNSEQMAQLETVAAGTVELRLAVITRHFDRFGIVC
ncbi:hypothetical protein GPALN_008013 [Globodera pallida]|uniref:B9 domain-containing protein 2 n=1 Tax=Globodera pallida TaxID=36090 RepID=A0A183C1F9_GLOPA|nr:hypothetical protein GPALN_008013 [Globodera pallida]